MASRDPTVYVTPWHPFTIRQPADGVEVVFVPRTKGVMHACPKNPAGVSVFLDYHLPSFTALPAGWCPACQTLYIGLSEEEAHAHLDKQANERPKEKA